MNILLTSAGRGNDLIEYFRRALAGRGLVLAADASAEAPAMREADKAFTVPPVTSPAYVDVLLEICRAERVRLVVSLSDRELPCLARQRERFWSIGVTPVVSSPEVIDLCSDKLQTEQFLRRLDIRSPKSYAKLHEALAAIRSGELTPPWVVKARWGTASVGLEFPESEEELALAWRLGMARLRRAIVGGAGAQAPGRCLIVQERLCGQEYGLDVVNDLRGSYVTTFVKKKLAMRSGETDRAVTVDHPRLQALGRRIGEALGHIGNLDCDVFDDGHELRVLELNPRFGGGYPFSHAGGANLPAALLAWANGEQPAPDWLRVVPGVLAAKCDRLVTVAPGPRHAEVARESSPAPQ